MQSKLSFLLVSFLIAASIISFLPSSNATTEEINGITYSHGIVTVTEQGQGLLHDQFVINDEVRHTNIYSGYIPLVTNYTLQDTIYLIVNYFYFFEYNNSEFQTKWLTNQEHMEQFVNTRISSIPVQYQDTLNVTEGLPHEVYFLSTGHQYLGSTYLNSTMIEYLDYNLIFGTYYHAIFVIPVAFLIKIITEQVYVTVNDTYYARAIVAAAYAYYYRYTADVTGYHVKITDGQTFGLEYFGTISSEVQYYESYTCFMSFFRMLLHNVTITSTDTRFTDSNGNVLYKYYPRNMLPAVIADYGHQTVRWNVTGTFKTRAPLQIAIQAFLTRSTNATADHFAVWGIANPTRMIAYQDGNDNNQLDVYLDVDNKIVHDPVDWVKYIGFPEAYSTDIDIEYLVDNNYTSWFFAPGIGLNKTYNLSNLDQGTTHVSIKIGNVDDNGDVVPRWNDPVVNSDGTVTFSWGMDYDDYPVIWYNTTDGTTIEDKEDIHYDYTYAVNLANGKAELSTTSTFGGINDQSLAAAVSDLSLATYQVSELLTIEKIVGSSDSGGINSYVPTGTTNVEISYSDSTELVDISMGGNKQTYHIDKNEYKTNTSVINLALITGSVTYSNDTEINEFNSESEIVGDQLTDAQKQQTTYDWLYRKDLILINYPNWGGKQIVHDPGFTSYFTPTTTPTNTNTNTPTPTETETNTGKTGAPAFAAVLALLTVSMLPAIKKRLKI